MESKKIRGGGGRSAPCGSGHWRGGREEQEQVEIEKRRRRQRRKTRRERESASPSICNSSSFAGCWCTKECFLARRRSLLWPDDEQRWASKRAHGASRCFSKEVGVEIERGKRKKKKVHLDGASLFLCFISLSLSLLAALPSSLASFTLPSLNGSSRQEWRRRTAAAAAAFSSSKRRRNRCRCGAVTVEHAKRRKEPFSVARLEQHVLFGLCRLRQQGPQGTVLEQRHGDDGGRGQQAHGGQQQAPHPHPQRERRH